MRSKITKEKIYVITTILVVSIVFIGIGYAFFTANNPKGSTAQIISKSGRMLINYNDGTDNIVPLTNIQPSDTILVDKTFTLTGINTTGLNGLSMPYVISIEYQNTFKIENGLEFLYFIKRIDTNENISCTLKGLGFVNDTLVSYGIPESQTGYVAGLFDDWSGNTSTQELAHGEFKSSSEEQVLTLNLRMMFRDTGYEQEYNKGATFNGKIVVTAPETNTFATDTWEEIANNVKSGNASKYSVGSEKEVEIEGKSYTVRVANNSTPSECSGTDFSQTACGFVVEFVDVVENRNMNPSGTYKEILYDRGWNVDGWPATAMRTYANGDFFNKLPEDLRNVIIDTKVISGHGSNDTDNFTSTDKIYLLSPHEVLEAGTEYNPSKYDTAWNNTRQLDYYKARNANADDHFASATKWYKADTEDMVGAWWLRTASSVNVTGFWGMGEKVYDFGSIADVSVGLAPAFRIGK